ASGVRHSMALRKDGSVLSWGHSSENTAAIPEGLSNVVAIAAAEGESMVMKADGRVFAWGDNHYGQTAVPAGLSNVVAITSAGDFNLAITTGSVPASVFITPHGRLAEREREADLVLKGQVISSSPITNAGFPYWGKSHAT